LRPAFRAPRATLRPAFRALRPAFFVRRAALRPAFRAPRATLRPAFRERLAFREAFFALFADFFLPFLPARFVAMESLGVEVSMSRRTYAGRIRFGHTHLETRVVARSVPGASPPK
jgi:hypothetical protein